MKRITNILALLVVAVQISAQSTYNVTPLFSPDLTGTARFVGMGGAMSALGGDISTISTNPAGIGIYRSADINASASLSTLNTTANFLGSSLSKDKFLASFENVGVVFAMDTYEECQSLKFINIGFNYSRRNNFRKDFAMNGWYANDAGETLYSQQFQIQDLYDNSQPNLGAITSASYHNPRYPWLPLLAADAGVLNTDGGIRYLPTDANFYSEDRGGVNLVDFNLSCNINDRLYLGMTIGAQYVDYERYSMYGEYDNQGVIYTLENWQKTRGEGLDVKLGAIVRPFEYSPLRLGLAFHLPTFYNLTDYSSAYMAGPNEPDGGYKDMYTAWPEAYGNDYIVDYTLRSPWRMNLSAGYTFSDILALNAEYELVDYSSANMEYADGYDMPDMNEEFDCNMKCSHIFRVGAEVKLDKNLSMRCGYNYISSAFREDAWKYISPTSAITATDYTNTKDTNIFTLGLGYRGKSYYFDIAYQCLLQDADFYTYTDPDVYLPATKVSDFRNKLVLTLGTRF